MKKGIKILFISLLTVASFVYISMEIDKEICYVFAIASVASAHMISVRVLCNDSYGLIKTFVFTDLLPMSISIAVSIAIFAAEISSAHLYRILYSMFNYSVTMVIIYAFIFVMELIYICKRLILNRKVI